MAFDNKYFKQQSRKELKRKIFGKGKPKDSILIVCEGKKTEPNYLQGFRVSSASIKIEGLGLNTNSLVEETIAIKKRAAKYGKKYDQIWCVFDRDANPHHNIQRAFALAKRENVKIAFSNEAFELWYLLHFRYRIVAINRHKCLQQVKALLGGVYKKNDENMYEKLLDRQEQAIANARHLMDQYNPYNPSNDNPSTTVYCLVEELNKFID